MVCKNCEMLDKGEVILNTKYWQVALSHGQSYLGRCYVTLKRHAGDLADLSKDETLDFLNLVRKLENALRKAFNATMFNWACLMNNAYQEKKPEPHVHWHFKPRYREKVKFAGMIFEDPEFGHHYSRERRIEISEQIMKKIAEKIRENLK